MNVQLTNKVAMQKIVANSEKVELALVDDLAKKVNSLESEFSPLVKTQIRIANEIAKTISDLESLNTKYSALDSEVVKIKKAFQELGIPMDSKTDMTISEIENRKKAIDKLVSKANKGYQALK